MWWRSWNVSWGWSCVYNYVIDEVYVKVYMSLYWYVVKSVGDKIGRDNNGGIYRDVVAEFVNSDG